jgi:hypothetical protein
MLYYSLLVCSLMLLSACNNPKSHADIAVANTFDTADSSLTPPPDRVTLTYRLASQEDWIKANDAIPYSEEQLKVLLFLNRVDLEHLHRLDTLVIPDTFLSDIKRYTPFPDSISAYAGIPKLILFSYAIQAFAVYENGALLRWGPVSMGRPSALTPTGLFHTNWRSKRTTSTVNSEWIMTWYFNLANFQGVSMHQYALPGYPASHGCVRLLEEDAKWLYYWCQSWILNSKEELLAHGTPVIIFGEYPFERRRPWLNLAENNKATQLNADALINETQQYIPTILLRQEHRDSLLKD